MTTPAIAARLASTLLALLPLLFAPGSPARAAETASVADADGTPLALIEHHAGRIQIAGPDGRALLTGKPRDDGGRKYKDEHGATFAKVKARDHGFKLETERGDLLWKVKTYGDRIKIANNEEGVLADQLRRRAADLWELERNDQVEGRIRLDPAQHRVEVTDAAGRLRWRIDGTAPSPAWGVLLIDMRAAEAYVLMAEIWARGW